MNAQSQIEKQLQDEFEKYYNSTYSGSVDIPSNILELFKKGVMALAPQFHKINMNKIKVIAYTDVHAWTNGDLKDVITIILNTPLEKLYYRFEDAVNGHIQLQKFILCYNENVEAFNGKLKMKKATLESLTSKNTNGNGMRIIN